MNSYATAQSQIFRRSEAAWRKQQGVLNSSMFMRELSMISTIVYNQDVKKDEGDVPSCRSLPDGDRVL